MAWSPRTRPTTRATAYGSRSRGADSRLRGSLLESRDYRSAGLPDIFGNSEILSKARIALEKIVEPLEILDLQLLVGLDLSALADLHLEKLAFVLFPGRAGHLCLRARRYK